MSKFNEANLKGKIKIIIIKIKQFFHLHTKPNLPNSKYKLSDLMKMNDGYRSMEKSMGKITKYVAGKFINDNQTVLDMPSGSACHAEHFIKRGAKYYGMDLSENAIAVALLRYPKNIFFNNSIYDVKNFFQPKIFDFVYCCAMLEHIGNWELAIKNMLYLSKDKVIIAFFQGLSSLMDQNYYEFHPFTDKNLLDFSIIPDYGYKPVITKQLSNLSDVYIFEQPGNFRIDVSIAKNICDLLDEQIKKQEFGFDELSNTVSLRAALRYAQDNNKNFNDYITKIPNCIEKREMNKNEVGYFMNRFSKQHMGNWMKEQGYNYEIHDLTKDDGTYASIIIIDNNLEK